MEAFCMCASPRTFAPSLYRASTDALISNKQTTFITYSLCKIFEKSHLFCHLYTHQGDRVQHNLVSPFWWSRNRRDRYSNILLTVGKCKILQCQPIPSCRIIANIFIFMLTHLVVVLNCDVETYSTLTSIGVSALSGKKLRLMQILIVTCIHESISQCLVACHTVIIAFVVRRIIITISCHSRYGDCKLH